MPAVSETPREPIFAEVDQVSFESQKPGTIALQRLPEVTSHDFETILPWTATSGTATALDGEAGHPGIVRLATGILLADNARITASSAVDATPIALSDVVGARLILRIGDITSFQLYAGFFGGSMADARFGNDSLIVEYDSAVNNKFRFVAKSASSTTAVDHASGPSNNTWYCFDLVRVSASAFQFYVNGVLSQTLSTNITSVPVGIGIAGTTLTAAMRSVDIDLARYEKFPQRY
jgi:hypothetical protein